ncbi:hypothetical protein A0H81_13881 [Grifola frondosa]|uniref:Uncharacterized protein n=1 Tax=Grifola frondosa TaxID=5627 RepID=A0A1C7LN32_GRIFR|nr:hypothetical protein A0H81_13881 [Grifola frondosa]
MTSANGSDATLSEEYVQECFHSYLKSSLTHAKAEGLLDTDTLSSAEADLMITGPALCLYFAALRSTTNPPSVPLPRRSKNSIAPPTELSLTNCPQTFRPFWLVWSQSVPPIQALVPEYQHDLARIICGLPPLVQPPNPRLKGIAADLRAVAIEISMRRTFQDRYASDLQAAIDAGGHSRSVKASFVPPPVYDDASLRPSSSFLSSPTTSSSSLSPIPPSPSSPTPSILTRDTPAIEFIRETLYAALADVLERIPYLRRLLRTDPPRAYFAAVAFAILDVASSSATRSPKTLMESGSGEPAVRGVLGQTVRLSQCPADLRPFMQELCAIGTASHEMEEEDSDATVKALQNGEDPPIPRLERVRDILQGGVGHAYNDCTAQGDEERSVMTESSRIDPRRRTTSTENRAVAFANRINALALGMTKLHAFRERQEIVFKVLAGVGG